MNASIAGSALAEPSSREARNMELMQTLDDAWNAQDMKVFESRRA